MGRERRTGFRDIKQEILRRIHDRTWAPGDKIPGEVALAEEFGCARTTVNRALQELSDEGLVERRRRAGTRVRTSPLRRAQFEIPLVRAEIEATGAVYRYNLVSQAQGKAPDWLRARLNLAQKTQTQHLQCMHFADNAAYQYEERWISCDAVPAASEMDFATVSPSEWLVREVPFTSVEIGFSATAATKAVAEFLQMQPQEPVFTTDRATWLGTQPVTFARFHYRRGYRITTRY